MKKVAFYCQVTGDPEDTADNQLEKLLAATQGEDAQVVREYVDHSPERFPAQGQVRRPSHGLPVRGCPGTPGVLRCPVQRPHRLSQLAGGHPRIGVERQIRARLGCADQEAGGGDAGPAGPQRWGVPVLRHHGR